MKDPFSLSEPTDGIITNAPTMKNDPLEKLLEAFNRDFSIIFSPLEDAIADYRDFRLFKEAFCRLVGYTFSDIYTLGITKGREEVREEIEVLPICKDDGITKNETDEENVAFIRGQAHFKEHALSTFNSLNYPLNNLTDK